MNKHGLSEKISQRISDISRKQVDEVINHMLSIIVETLQKGEKVSLSSFGMFLAKKRGARFGVNPQRPGEKIKISEMYIPKFRSGSGLKKALKSALKPTQEKESAEIKESSALPPTQ
jgi:DNA-binding protein HU-beta